MCSGGIFGGDAWSKDHDKILKHARQLRYDEVPGVTLPSADAPKQEWISKMDAFNAWKAREVAKEASGNAWWQRGNDVGSGGESGGSSGSSGRSGLLDSNIGPYPRPNKYFPLLTQAYDRPQARDYSEFIQAGNPFGGDGGLLYQPWSQQYSERYGLPDEIAQYQPNIFGVGPVSYYGAPFGPLNITPPEELFGNEEEEEKEEEGTRGGKEGNSGDSHGGTQPGGAPSGGHHGVND